MPYSISKKTVKEVRYLNKDFSSFKANLIEFAKVYFPDTYNDFNESSPGMMFIEMASYVGDVLSYYIDNQFKESLLAFAEEKKTVYNMAQSFGYKPKVATPAVGMLNVFQTVPAISSGIGENYTTSADLRYALEVKSGMQISSTAGINYKTVADVNFKYSSSYDPMTVSIYESSGNVPVTYLLKKSVKIESGETATEYFTFGDAEKYSRIKLSNSGVTEIVSCVDDDGNNWHEVGFLAQDNVFEDMENSSINDPELSSYADQAPYLMKLIKTSKRFVTHITNDNKTEIRFGSGISNGPDEELVPNPNNVGSSLPGSPTYLNTAFDPVNFLNTKTYGQAPSNTTLTITYRYGGGVTHNAIANSIKNIQSVNLILNGASLNAGLVSSTKSSLAVTNPEPTSGGLGAESIFQVKQNTLAYFQAQQRAVTKQDYITRVYAMPPKYGNIAKAYIVQDSQIDPSAGQEGTSNRIENPLALNLYVLGYDAGRNLVNVNKAVKSNIQTYLTQFRMITDAVNIKDAYVINIGVKFNLLTKTGYNKEQVVLRAIQKVKNFFDIDKWQIGQPIVLADLAYQISLVDGVSAVVPPEDVDSYSSINDRPPVQIINKFAASEGYSGNLYDIKSATREGVIYPSMDPSCFQLKFPSTDIEGRVVGDSAGGGN